MKRHKTRKISQSYSFVGYAAYRKDIVPHLESFITKYMKCKNPYLMYAINEAVLNAAKYGCIKDGLVNTHVKIECSLIDHELSIKIESRTRNFDAYAYQCKLQTIAQDERYKFMDWGDFINDVNHIYTNFPDSRGFFYMLMACEYLILDENGDFIKLKTKVPYNDRIISKKICDLALRFLVQTKDGYII